MSTIQHNPLRLPANRDERIARALAVDDGCVMAGGLPAKLGLLPELRAASMPSTTPTLSAAGVTALSRLVQLARRDRGQTPEVFASKLGLDLSELVELESGCGAPELRVLHLVSIGLKLSYEKLQMLVGYRQARDSSLERETMRFAASSGPMDKLSKSEAQALHDFVRALHD